MVKLSQDAPPRGFPPGTLIDGRYKVVRFIGQGGAGLVHEVEHARTGRRLAMKTLLDEAGYARLEQEAKATSLMKNPHAVKITDMGTGTGIAAGPYLVMELLEGQSLRALLDDAGQLPAELTVNIALQVCECLAEAHGHGIVHRDLKPENVILAASPWPGQYDVKVLDFGVVKLSEDGPIPHSSLTRTGSTVGTPYYMSLEQLRNSSAVDARADIYALGVVLYEGLSGRKPFEADTIGDLVYALCSGPPTHISRLRPDAPAEVCQVVMRALSMNREDRQASMEEVATALLPFGNPAFGLWMRAEGRQKGAGGQPAGAVQEVGKASASRRAPLVGPAAGKPAAAPPRPAGAAPPPEPSSGVARAEAPPDSAPPELPTVTLPPSTATPRPPLEQSSAAIPRPPVEQSSAAIPRPVLPGSPPMDEDSDGGRDTPTEMYAKGEHPAAPGDRDTPTRSLDSRYAAEADAVPDGGRSRSPRVDAAYGHFVPGPTMPTPGAAPGFAPIKSTIRLPMQTGAPSPYAETAPPADSQLERPGWQRSLDTALVRVGDTIEQGARGALARFREASPRAQLVIAVGGASLLTATLVLLLYVIFR